MSSTRKSLCPFTHIYLAKFPFMKDGRNLNETKCPICNSYVSIKYNGAGGIEKHVTTEEHLKMSRNAPNVVNIYIIIQPRSTTECKIGSRSDSGVSYRKITSII